MNTICFDFEGKCYEVAGDTYPGKDIQLPDGRMLQVQGWRETYPYQVAGLKLTYLSANFNQATEV